MLTAVRSLSRSGPLTLSRARCLPDWFALYERSVFGVPAVMQQHMNETSHSGSHMEMDAVGIHTEKYSNDFNTLTDRQRWTPFARNISISLHSYQCIAFSISIYCRCMCKFVYCCMRLCLRLRALCVFVGMNEFYGRVEKSSDIYAVCMGCALPSFSLVCELR